jgi:hypothetical protein
LPFYIVSCFTSNKFLNFNKFFVKCERKKLNEGYQIHNFISSSGSTGQKVTVPTVPVLVAQRCLNSDGGALLVLALAARAKLVHLVLGQVQDRFHHVLAVAVRGLNKWIFHKKPIFFISYKSQTQMLDLKTQRSRPSNSFSQLKRGGVVDYLTFQYVYVCTYFILINAFT